MPIASLLIEVTPGAETEVAARLDAIVGVEVWARGTGQLVVVTESPDLAADRALTARIEHTDGVLITHIVFFSLEDSIAGVAARDGEETRDHG